MSDNAGDTTQTVTITGRVVGGAIETEVLSLNGTTPVVGIKTFERILKIVKSATTTGTITIDRSSSGPNVMVLLPAVLEGRSMFLDSASAASPKSLYEKVFFKNENGVDTLTNSNMTLTLEPAAAQDYLMAVEDAVDDTGTSTNRVTAPTGVSVFRQINIAEPIPGGGDLAAGEAIGVWMQMDLAADNAGVLDDYTLKLDGTTV